MEQIPKIVSQRLQAVSAPIVHPDANLLAAFAEKSLPPREQVQILDHLAGCAACRDVVAHAQPEEVLERIAVAAAAPSSVHRHSWLQGTVVRWAALGACVVVVGTVVISRSHFSNKSPAMVATNDQPVVVAKTEPQSSPSATPEKQNLNREYESKGDRLKEESVVAGNKRDADELFELDKQPPAKTLSSGSGERRQQDPVGRAGRDFEAKSNIPAVTETVEVSASVPAPVSPEDAKATKKEFSADKAMKGPIAANEVAQAQATPAPPPPPAAAKPTADSSLADSQRTRAEAGGLAALYKAKDGYVTTETAAAGKFRSDIRYPTPRWQLSADGKLIKSSDLGKSWQPVPIGDKVIFRALCIANREVWVGGANGNLFYSSNAGENWEQVKPSTNGKNLTGDITAIAFTDPQHGKVTTTSHETWITSDGGHIWQVETR